MAKAPVRPRNWKAMREDRVLAMAQNRFGRMFASKDAAIAALAKLPAKEQRSLKKVAVSVAQKAAQSSAARSLVSGMSAAGKTAAKRVAPLAIAGIVIAALNRPVNAKDTKMDESKKEKTKTDRVVDGVVSVAAGAQAVAMLSSAKDVGVGLLAKSFLRVGGLLSAAYAISSGMSALSSEAKAAAPVPTSDAPSPTIASDGGVVSSIGDGVKAAADFLTFGTAGLALDAGSQTRKLIAEAKIKRDASMTRPSPGQVAAGAMTMPGPPPAFFPPSTNGKAFLNDAAGKKASTPASQVMRPAAAAPGRVDGTTDGYVRASSTGKAVTVKGYNTPTRR